MSILSSNSLEFWLKPSLCTYFNTSIALFLSGSCFWVAVLDGRVVGIVAAQGREDDNTVELRRMSVDSRYRGKGIAKALGRRVLEFAMRNNYTAVVLGTTAVKLAAHKLYESLGFRRTGQSEDYRLPGMSRSPLERLFFQIRYSRYRLQLREEWEVTGRGRERWRGEMEKERDRERENERESESNDPPSPESPDHTLFSDGFYLFCVFRDYFALLNTSTSSLKSLTF